MTILLLCIITLLFGGAYRYRNCKNSNYELAAFDNKNLLPIRGLMAISIVLHHLSLCLYIKGLSQFEIWGEYIVACFFFISGYGLTTAYRYKGEDYLKGFLKRRIGKIIIPYLICVITNIICNYLFTPNYNLQNPPVQTVLDYYFGYNYTNVLLPSSWFVHAILFLYLCFYLIMKSFKSINIAIGGIFIINILLFFYFFPMYKLVNGVPLFSFTLGMLFAVKENIVKDWVQKNVYITIITTLALIIIVYKIIPVHFIQIHNFGVIFIPLFLVLGIYSAGTKHLTCLNPFGKISYEIYLVQGAVCVFLLLLKDYPFLYVSSVLLICLIFALLLNRITAHITYINNN